eukprot:CCRYP_017246-RC/>CCRYP_017246-RC protein AED:0.15 eAED:0.15 QI:74/1/1/1/1/1/6/1144/2412
MKRKRPAPLGVLEFTSALNGEDALSILTKLRHFVHVVGHQRRIALGSTDGNVDTDATSDDRDDDDDGSVFSLFNDDEEPFAKRQKVEDKDGKTPAWQMDKNNYRVPFVGTSVAKGEVGSVVMGVWPTGFLEAYRQHSPLGVELVRNDYISALPPGGIHRSLCKGGTSTLEDEASSGGKRHKKGHSSSSHDDKRELTRGQIISLSLQYYYWSALSEWVLGFVPCHTLKRDLYWEDSHTNTSAIPETKPPERSTKSEKCAIPPAIMTILMKQRLPEWIEKVHLYASEQHQYIQQQMKTIQQQKQQRKKQANSKEEQQIQQKLQQQHSEKLKQQQTQWEKKRHRDGILLASVIRNLRVLCYASIGTAREVLRRLTMGSATSATTKNLPATGTIKAGGKVGGSNVKGGSGGETSWMIQLLQEKRHSLRSTSTSSSYHHTPQVECLNLVCTLLETNDYTILSRICQAPVWSMKQGSRRGGKSDGRGANNLSSTSGGNYCLLYTALRYGIQHLIDDYSDMNCAMDSEVDNQNGLFARSLTRLLRDVREILLPNDGGEISEAVDRANQRDEGFILGVGATADLLSGEVLTNLTKLALLAPSVDSTMDSIRDIISGNDCYSDLSPVESTAAEGRRLLFILLSKSQSSPFLNVIRLRDRNGQFTKNEEQSAAYLSQLSKSLHTLMTDREHKQLIRSFLRSCLETTPQLVPHIFSGLNMSDPKPNYRTLSSLTFVDSVVRDAPSPQKVLFSHLRASQGKKLNLSKELGSLDKVIPVVIPTCVSKVSLGKIVQSSSALLVSSGLKLIITLLRRADELLSSLVMGYPNDGRSESKLTELRETIRQAILHHLPQVSLLLSIPTRFDPFVEETASKANAIVIIELCKALECYGQLDPSLIVTLQFDWVKLLPCENQGVSQEPLRNFFNAEPLAQNAILRTLIVVSRIDNSPSSKLLSHVMSIVTASRVKEVYATARELALSLIQNELFTQAGIDLHQVDDETASCSAYECSLWIDGMSTSIIPEIATWIGEMHQQRVQQKIFVSQAWAHCDLGFDVPPLRVSLLLSYLISELFRQEKVFSPDFSLLVVRIATKLLIFQSDPRLLASIIVYGSNGIAHKNVQHANLSQFAMAIIQNHDKTVLRLNSLLSSVFDSDSACITVKAAVSNTRQLACSTALRQCLSLLRYQGDDDGNLGSLLRKILVCSFHGSSQNISDATTVLTAAFENKILNPTDMHCIAAFFLAFSNSKASAVVSMLASTGRNTAEMELAFAILQISLAPTSKVPNIIEDVLKHIVSAILRDDSTGNLGRLTDFFVIILLELVPTVKILSTTKFSPETLFDLWAVLSKHPRTDLSVKLCLRLEDYMSHLFASPDHYRDQWIVYRRIIKTSPQLFINACLNTTRRRALLHESCDRPAARSFLSEVFSYDCSNICHLSKTISEFEDNAEVMDLWNDGRFDCIASTFVFRTKTHESRADITTSPSYKKALSVISKRLIHLLDQEDEGNRTLSTKSILQLLQTLCSVESMPSSLPSRLLDLVCSLESGKRSKVVEDELCVMKLVHDVCPLGENESSLLTYSFLRCCKLLPKLLKNFVRDSQTSASCSLVTLMIQLSRFLEQISSFDNDILPSSSAIDKAIVACLKYGLMDPIDQSTNSIFAEALNIVSCVLKASDSTKNRLGSFTPGQIHAMVVSHSSFRRALSDKCFDPSGSRNDVTQQRELIRLLICCVSIDAKNVKVDSDTWLVILSTYTAGTRDVDRFLRRLIFLYERNNCFEEKIAMHNIRWGSMSTQQNTDKNNERWEWFLDALDSNRVRQTLSQYPVSDALEPLPEHSIEACNSSTNIIGNGDDDSFSESVEDNGHDDSESQSSDTVSDPKNAGVAASTTWPMTSYDMWRGNGEDPRYSPGFILPLVLGALEDCLPAKMDAGSESPKSVDAMQVEEEHFEEEHAKREQCQAFCHFSRRLCDKGAIPLALSSLSSRCPRLRKVAIAICGLFLKALQMPESHGMKSWSERPQLEMIMSSVQRGLAMRRALQIQRAKDDQDDRPINVPMLPAVSAVFLAKALMILTRPGDDMYGPMNRYFLRLKDVHGAFQDCFTLPAFLSLYCNSSDDLSRCKIERNWALLSLKDGVVDEFCYRIIAKHHIPELLMSSLDSLIGNPECTGEVSLTVDVLCSLIKSGGRRAATDFVHRLGILSWLHGIISWRPIASVLPYISMKCKYVKLITAAVQAYIRCLPSETSLFFEKIPLSNAAMQICLEGYSGELENTEEPDESSSTSLLESTCDALWEIHLADRMTSQGSTCFDFGATTLADMTRLLAKFVSHDKMFGNVLSSLCTIPYVATEDDSSSAQLFCKLTLGYIAHAPISEISQELLLLSLERVHALMKRYNHLMGDDPMIFSLVLKCRRLASGVDGGIQVWDRIMALLQDADTT